MPVDKEFYVSEEVQTYINQLAAKGAETEDAWNTLFEEYKKAYPELAAQYEKDMNGFIDVEALDAKDFWTYDEKPNATRATSGQVIQKLVKIIRIFLAVQQTWRHPQRPG